MIPRSIRRHTMPLLVALCVVGGVVLTACGSSDADTTAGTTKSPNLEKFLQAHDWLLDPSDSSIGTTRTGTVTLVVADGKQASGSAPCNTYRSTLELSENNGIRFTDTITTRKACDEPTTAAENAFLEALAAVRTADTSDPNRLVLTGGSSRLAFERFDPAQNLSGTWTITSIRTTDALASPIENTEPTITFGDGHRVHVATGCNTLTATWKTTGSGVTFEPGMSTLMACTSPEGLAEQEHQLSDALTATRKVDISGDTLHLVDGSGNLLVVATRGD